MSNQDNLNIAENDFEEMIQVKNAFSQTTTLWNCNLRMESERHSM